MSYVRRTRTGPEIGVGGFSTTESQYSGGKRRKKRAAKRRKKRMGGVGIKAPIHSFGKPAGISTGRNKPKY